jgi:DnaJ-class molecular chaperone
LHITYPDGHTERLQVKIPPGMDTGARLRLGRKGASGKNGGPAGDLYVVVHITPHAYFTRDGYDLLCELPVTLEEAMLGAKVDVPTIDGTITMTLPACTQNKQRFRLRGKGVPQAQNGTRGDQYVTICVVLPSTLDTQSQQLIAEFARRNPLQPRVQMR